MLNSNYNTVVFYNNMQQQTKKEKKKREKSKKWVPLRETTISNEIQEQTHRTHLNFYT